MKERLGWVSNSSSSSFLLFFDKKHTIDNIEQTILGLDEFYVSKDKWGDSDYINVTDEVKEELRIAFIEGTTNKKTIIEELTSYIKYIIKMSHRFPDIIHGTGYAYFDYKSLGSNWDLYGRPIFYNSFVNKFEHILKNMDEKSDKEFFEILDVLIDWCGNYSILYVLNNGSGRGFVGVPNEPKVDFNYEQLAERIYNLIDFDKFIVKQYRWSDKDSPAERLMERGDPLNKLHHIKISKH